ncbi:MAG: ArsC family reductase [Burkholderiales bacterium]|jgi:arsenate reductase
MSETTSLKSDVKIYGIPNCEQVKKAKTWFNEQGQAFEFHDFKKQGVQEELLNRWLQHLPWDALLNRKGTTWRQLLPEQRDTIVDQRSAVELMLAKPSIIKRPVVEIQDRIVLGFHPEMYL